jgi:hypothetical protein
MCFLDKHILQAIEKFLETNEFPELQKFSLGKTEWEALRAFQSILEVRVVFVDYVT